MSSYCPNCERYVDGKKTFHGVAFLLIIIFIWGPGFWLGGVLGTLSAKYTGDPTILGLWLIWMSLPFIYILYHVFAKKPRCPICNTPISREVSTNQIGQKPKVSRETPSAQISQKPIHKNSGSSKERAALILAIRLRPCAALAEASESTMFVDRSRLLYTKTFIPKIVISCAIFRYSIKISGESPN